MIYPLMVLDIEVVADYPPESKVERDYEYAFGALTGELDKEIVVMGSVSGAVSAPSVSGEVVKGT